MKVFICCNLCIRAASTSFGKTHFQLSFIIAVFSTFCQISNHFPKIKPFLFRKALNTGREAICPCYFKITGLHIISVLFESRADKRCLITLADEDIIDEFTDTLDCTDNKYFDKIYKDLDITFGNNWEIYDEIPLVECFVECSECGKEFSIELTEDNFKQFIKRTVSKDSKRELDFEFNFLCNDCYEYFNKQ